MSQESPRGVPDLQPTAGSASAASGLEALKALRSLWPSTDGPLRAREPIRQLCAQIRLEHRIAESLRAAPLQAGPLNSQGVVVRTLQRLQQLSPAYVAHLMKQVDAWMALEALIEEPKTAQTQRTAQTQQTVQAAPTRRTARTAQQVQKVQKVQTVGTASKAAAPRSGKRG